MSDSAFSFEIKSETRDGKIIVCAHWDGNLTVDHATTFVEAYLKEIEGLDRYYLILNLGITESSTAAREQIRKSIGIVELGLVKSAVIGHTPRQRLLVETFLLSDGVNMKNTKIFVNEEEAWDYILSSENE